MTTNPETIFISYATPDRDRVRPFCEFLKKVGLQVWIDYEHLKPGQNWNHEIKRALSHAGFVVVFISNNSVDRRGYVQRELKVALDLRAEKLIDDIFLIPVLLDDDVVVPDQIAEIQHVSASRPDCLDQLKEAIDIQLHKLGTERRVIEEEQGLTWSIHQFRESWEGLPGYEVALQFITVKSNRYAGLEVVSDFLRGQFLERLLRHRASRFEQVPDAFNYGQDKVMRTNTLDAVCGSPTLVGSVLSIPYEVSWYGAGAVHPNSHFEVFNFLLNPVALVPKLESLFTDYQEALAVFQDEVRRQLKGLVDADGTPRFDPKWVDEGTETWKALSAYGFLPDGIRILFSPYQVAAYAYGSHAAVVSYKRIVRMLRPAFVSALGLNYLLYSSG